MIAVSAVCDSRAQAVGTRVLLLDGSGTLATADG
jgi:hypothetical protein